MFPSKNRVTLKTEVNQFDQWTPRAPPNPSKRIHQKYPTFPNETQTTASKSTLPRNQTRINKHHYYTQTFRTPHHMKLNIKQQALEFEHTESCSSSRSSFLGQKANIHRGLVARLSLNKSKRAGWSDVQVPLERRSCGKTESERETRAVGGEKGGKESQ